MGQRWKVRLRLMRRGRGKERVQVDVHIQNMSDHARGWVNKRIYMYMVNEREREHMDGEMVPQTTSRCEDRP